MDEVKVLDEQTLVGFVTEQIAKCKKNGAELQAYLNISYYLGKQWIKIDRSANHLVEPPKEPWQVRFVANKIQPIVRTELAKMTKNKPAMFVNPATNDDSDIRAARVAEKILAWLEYELDLQALDRLNCLWGLCTGISFIKPFWNPNKGRSFKDDKGNTMHEGDVDICVVPLFELKFDTAASNWNEMAWMCHEKVRTVDYIRDAYGVEVEPESGISACSLYDSKLKTLSVADVGLENRVLDDSAVVHEYWERPSSKYPKGRRITVCSGKVLLYEEDIGFGDKDDTPRELPFFAFRHIDVPGRLWPTCVTEQLIPIQREYNKSRSQIIENKNLVGNPIMLAPVGCLDEEPTNEPGQLIEYNPVGGKPEYMIPPAMGADVYKNLDYLDGEFEFVSGQHETSHGQTPAGVTSGTAIGFLQEQDDTKLGPSTANFVDCKKQYERYLLKMMQQCYTEERTVRIAGDDRRVETLSFRGSDITSIDVRVDESTMYQYSRAAKQDFVIKLVQYGLLQPGNERDRQLIMKILEFGIIDDVYSSMEQDTAQAATENAKFETGDLSPDVRDFYNHEAHIKEHNRLRKSETYLGFPPELRMAIDTHVDLHVQYLMESMAPTMPPAETEDQAPPLNTGAPESFSAPVEGAMTM